MEAKALGQYRAHGLKAPTVVVAVLSLVLAALLCVCATHQSAYAEEIYTVTFGDTGVVKTVKEGETITGPIPQPAKTREGKLDGAKRAVGTFVGWTDAEAYVNGEPIDLWEEGQLDKEDLFDVSQPIYGNIYLSAVYTVPECRVSLSYKYPDGRGDTISFSVPKGGTIREAGSNYIKAFTFKGYNKLSKKLTCAGWINSKTKKKVTLDTRIMESTNLVANIESKYISEASISVQNKTYTGKAVKPKVTVKMGNKKLKQGRDFTVKYSHNVKVGEGKAKIVGKGKYKGSKTVNFGVVPPATSITKVKGVKGGFKVTWKKQKYATGYNIYYRYVGQKGWDLPDKSIFGGSKTSCTVKVTKPGKKVQVRVEPVKWLKKKALGGGYDNWYYYGNYSKTKTVKTKK